jgi:DNA-binding transcriptional regulator YiaG
MAISKFDPEEPTSGKTVKFFVSHENFHTISSEMRRQTASRSERLLKAPVKAQSIPTRDGFEIAQASRRLGLTQEQLAAALNVTIQTLRNWQNGQDAKRMSSKTGDLHELLSRMDEYVIAPKEKAWLSAPLEAFGGRSPQELITERRSRELVVEFDRLREAQPV